VVNAGTREIARLFDQAVTELETDRRRGMRSLKRCIELDDGSDCNARGKIELPPFRLRPYLVLALELDTDGDSERALAVLDQAKLRWPDDSHLYMHYGEIYRGREDWSRAEDAYKRCCRLHPRAYIAMTIATVLDQQQRHAEAEWWLCQTLVIDPCYEEAHFNLACLEAKRGNHAAAELRFRRALELDPDYMLAHRELGMLLFLRLDKRDGCYSRHPSWEPALRHLTRAAELDPRDPRTLNALEGMHNELALEARRRWRPRKDEL
jgi:tetratricopeptide (TPR) repeat protein